jgi:2-amino-4,5-dihydroxy-6-oxo-7-(phosphooxy)heptanoate synthase
LNASLARQIRLRRLFRHDGDRLLLVPLDHPISDGPVTGGRRVDGLLGQLAAGGADAVVLHKGCLRHVDPAPFQWMSLVVHLSASTAHAPDPDAKYLVTSVKEALRLGADAVSVHVNLGSRDEARQIADLGRVAEACDRWNLPLLAMMYPRGPKILDPQAPDLVAHGATIAAELGADLVKIPWVGSVAAMAHLVSVCPVPLLVAGGPKQDSPNCLLGYVEEVLSSGVAGLAIGRNIFQSPNPMATARMIADRVHTPVTPTPVPTLAPVTAMDLTLPSFLPIGT